MVTFIFVVPVAIASVYVGYKIGNSKGTGFIDQAQTYFNLKKPPTKFNS